MFNRLRTAFLKIPDTKDSKDSGSIFPVIDEKLCILCRSCFTRCPEGAFSITRDKEIKLSFDKNYCTLCGLCLYICPVSAIKPGNDPKPCLFGDSIGNGHSIPLKQVEYIYSKIQHLIYSNSRLRNALFRKFIDLPHKDD